VHTKTLKIYPSTPVEVEDDGIHHRTSNTPHNTHSLEPHNTAPTAVSPVQVLGRRSKDYRPKETFVKVDNIFYIVRQQVMSACMLGAPAHPHRTDDDRLD
jgi:hypothetical protein